MFPYGRIQVGLGHAEALGGLNKAIMMVMGLGKWVSRAGALDADLTNNSRMRSIGKVLPILSACLLAVMVKLTSEIVFLGCVEGYWIQWEPYIKLFNVSHSLWLHVLNILHKFLGDT